MDQADLLRHAIGALDQLGVPYMVVGSLASMSYGEPRYTHDIDIVVDLAEHQVPSLCAAFSDPDFYVSEPAAREAVRARRQFNVIHSRSGGKIDFMVVKDTPWGRAQISRRRQHSLLPGLTGYAASPEDVILGKLQYYREGESPKHLRDITSMLTISGDQIDRDDIARWTKELGVAEIWDSILSGLEQTPT